MVWKRVGRFSSGELSFLCALNKQCCFWELPRTLRIEILTLITVLCIEIVSDEMRERDLEQFGLVSLFHKANAA